MDIFEVNQTNKLLNTVLTESELNPIDLAKKFAKGFKYHQLDNLKKLLSMLNLKSGKAPRGMKDAYETMKRVDKMVELRNEDNLIRFNPGLDIEKSREHFENDITQSFSRLDYNGDLEKIISKLSDRVTQVHEIKGKYAHYFNRSTMSEKNFKENVDYIEKFFKTLKGYHQKALKEKGGVKIYFVKKNETKAGATYKSLKDVIFIRPDKVVKGDNYGSFVYVLLHELGHRYEKYNKQSTNFDSPQWWTTKYSKTTNSMWGEQFAELFALSHWPSKYKEFSDKIEAFNKAIK